MADAAPRVLVDGRGVAADAAAIPVLDRGFAYGDGVFRTVRIEAGEPWLWADHLSKLGADARRLGMDLPGDHHALIDTEVRSLVGRDSGVLRVVLTRGSGPRGDRPPAAAVPRRVLLFQPGKPPMLSTAPCRVRLCRTRLPVFPELAGAKHLNRLPQVLARQEWPGPRPEEGLLADADGHLVCGTMTNLFLREGDRVSTPDLSRCGVDGVMRQRILSGKVPGLPEVTGVIEVCHISCERLLRADEVWLSNAVIGVWAVGAVEDADGRELARYPAPGPVTVAIVEGLEQLLEAS